MADYVDRLINRMAGDALAPSVQPAISAAVQKAGPAEVEDPFERTEPLAPTPALEFAVERPPRAHTPTSPPTLPVPGTATDPRVGTLPAPLPGEPVAAVGPASARQPAAFLPQVGEGSAVELPATRPPAGKTYQVSLECGKQLVTASPAGQSPEPFPANLLRSLAEAISATNRDESVSAAEQPPTPPMPVTRLQSDEPSADRGGQPQASALSTVPREPLQEQSPRHPLGLSLAESPRVTIGQLTVEIAPAPPTPPLTRAAPHAPVPMPNISAGRDGAHSNLRFGLGQM